MGCVLCFGASYAQSLSLDSCRARAIRYNKSLQVADELVRQSEFRVKAARGAYMPRFDFVGVSFYNRKNLQLVDVDRIHSVMNAWGIPSALASMIVPDDFLELDIHSVTAGAFSVVQPLFLGGKMLAVNDMAASVARLSRSQRNMVENEVVATVDEAYWLVVSLVHKLNLAHSYVALIDTLYDHVDALIDEGMATRADKLTVAVTRNEAEVLLNKTQNGLSVARMLLAQLCGMPIDTTYTLQDETWGVAYGEELPAEYSMLGVYGRREEIRSLEYITDITRAQQRMALSDMLPSVALVGLYTFNSPNLYQGFKNDFDGMFRVGVVLKIPIFHWGTDYYLYKAARSATVVSRMETDIAKERIELQVNQCRYTYTESIKTYRLTDSNIEQAQQNLDNARYAYAEGVYTLAEVMAAQTAWYQAYSAWIDAGIAVAVARDNYARAVGIPLY